VPCRDGQYLILVGLFSRPAIPDEAGDKQFFRVVDVSEALALAYERLHASVRRTANFLRLDILGIIWQVFFERQSARASEQLNMSLSAARFSTLCHADRAPDR